ncbi:epsin-2-like [Panonychus citri]|uniref:epsin-2-like n=1 Tax=Panonychus citri TaxID=50023 RepID=UPI002307A961|nr:epsin-2-like [Panonychus citri]
MINVRGLQRNVKNVVKNYTEPQVKVREATSNDPWGPSSTLMSEIADLTYNVVAFSEIMQMIWKRLNDHGKNWRHVYKALVLLEYLIKTGSEKVAQQCRENIFAIQTLKDFQYLEDNKDQGMNVREKSKALVALLKDDERLKTERTRALTAKERFAQSVSLMNAPSGIETIPKPLASLGSFRESIASASALEAGKPLPSDLESARPQTKGEEELQLQLALAMSKEEAEQEDRLRKNDEIRFQLALNESQKEKLTKKTAMDDLLNISVGSNPPLHNSSTTVDPWSVSGDSMGAAAFPVPPPPPPPLPLQSLGASSSLNNTQSLASNDPWSVGPGNHVTNSDPWNGNSGRTSATNDPWQSSPPALTPQSTDPWSSQTGEEMISKSPVKETISSSISFDSAISSNTQTTRKTPENFLGPNSNLVNLDALVSSKTTGVLPAGGNPFATVPVCNPFQAAKPPPPTINQLRSQNIFPMGNDSISSLTGPLGPSTITPVMPVTMPNNHPLSSQPMVPLSSPSSSHNPFAM